MSRTPIPDEVVIQVWKKVQRIWDIGIHYWYPLTECRRKDVIAFKADYIDDVKIEYLKQVLLAHGVQRVYEFRESGRHYETSVTEMLPFYAPYDEFVGEGFWCDDYMDWIIYASHEGTFTVGGGWLVNQLKSAWKDWQNYIDWDTKNLSE